MSTGTESYIRLAEILDVSRPVAAAFVHEVERRIRNSGLPTPNLAEVTALLEQIPKPLRSPENLVGLYLSTSESESRIQSGPASASATPTPPAPISTRLAGVTFENRQEVIATLSAGDPLILQRQPDHPHDSNAIAVFTTNGQSAGFVPRDLAISMAPQLDAIGGKCRAEVVEIVGGSAEASNLGIEILISLEPDSETKPIDETGKIDSDTQIYAQLTAEQRQVAFHPLGRHARVLAVAGSGKTTTMAYRIHYLLAQGQSQNSILVLMFNTLAREQFEEKLGEIGIPAHRRPPVRTFHAFAFKFITDLKKEGLLSAESDFWIGDREEQVRLTVHRALRELIEQQKVSEAQIDIEEAMTAISLWKGSLIPPERAGYRGDKAMPLVYERFELLRQQENGITFDDFVPLAVHFLERNKRLRRRWCNRLKFLIVDEYQDVNYGQQRLIELIAGSRADVMVVGDDDQTIYEWRGARPNYIIREFHTAFAEKSITEYKLTNSFRFGCLLAQTAYNVISFNTNRVSKSLTAHFPRIETDIQLYTNSSEQSSDIDRELTDQVISLVKAQGIAATQIVVLGRTFAQLSGLQAEFLARKVPFRVVGQAPFYERTENRAILAYLRVALSLDEPCSPQNQRSVVRIANTPRRYLTRSILEQAFRAGTQRQMTVGAVLQAAGNSPDSPYSQSQRQRVNELNHFLLRLRERISTEPELGAGDLLAWIATVQNLSDHYNNYYGKGEDSVERQQALAEFIAYTQRTGLPAQKFIHHVDRLDPTLGLPEEQLIVMTTVHRTKGLEFDYVFIPACQEGYMPCLYSDSVQVYDSAGIVKEPEPSEVLENERRLFYVAVTRARKGLYLGVALPPEKGAQKDSKPPLPSRFLDEMELGPSRSVLYAYVDALNERDNGKKLIGHMSRLSGHHKILRTLQDTYAQHLSETTLRERVRSVGLSAAERPFTYRFAYAPPKKQGDREEPRDVWSHIEF